MMINILHLLWIVPVSLFAGLLLASLASAAKYNSSENENEEELIKYLNELKKNRIKNDL